MDNKCTFCGKNFNGIKVSVSLFLESERLRADTTWEHIPNMDIHTREFLCEDCFSEFSSHLSDSMNNRINNVNV